MAGKSTLDPDNFPLRRGRKNLKGHDTNSLGPSDTSDSGSDMQGPGLLDADRLHLDRGTTDDPEAGSLRDRDPGSSLHDLNLDDNSDSGGTGERLTAGQDPKGRLNSDRGTDRIVESDEAGLGGGLDQAEEAQLGVTDEELKKQRRRK